MKKSNTKEKVLVGISGGVDSAVSAHILREKGYEVVGVTFQMFDNKGSQNSSMCSSSEIINYSKKVANTLGIEHHIINLEKTFEKKVIKYFVEEYLAGRTPNPCVLCNRYVKFEELLRTATKMNIKYVATGHYAKVEKTETNRYILKKSASKTKDQTYFLYDLTQEQLSRVIFPLEGITKDKVRNIAKDLKLPIADRDDSQEICFVQDKNYNKFIQEHSDNLPSSGDIVDSKGNILGRHTGIYNYTIGQRKGLGISSKKPLFVIEIDIAKNEIVVGDDIDTLKKEFDVKNINLISVEKLTEEMEVDVKVRSTAKEAKGRIFTKGKYIRVVLCIPQRAITPGQSAVFYKENIVVGGGIIV